MIKYVSGQRWISEMEPELGMGTVKEVDPRIVCIYFAASGETRNYSTSSTPLKRVQFSKGDNIKDHSNKEHLIEDVLEENDLFTYLTDQDLRIHETELNDSISFSKPQDRLIAGITDEKEIFELRYKINQEYAQIQESEYRGFTGAKIDLIPHQLYIAHEVSEKQIPRVMLCDEVGLGKTIEAALILHRLYISGQVRRVLILLPENLINQWFIELYRKFNLHFQIFDEDRCHAIQETQPDTNPFLEDALVIAQLDYLANNPSRSDQVIHAEWDLVIVDEAHHLDWEPEKSSPEYDLVKEVSADSEGLLLLTATPQQLGGNGHFARLQLLDPDRFHSLELYNEEVLHYNEVALIANEIIKKKALSEKQKDLLLTICKHERHKIEKLLAEAESGKTASRTQLIENLLDQHGTGRVIFRNTRSTIKGFPKRKLVLDEITSAKKSTIENIEEELKFDLDHAHQELSDIDYSADDRIDWLVDWLRKNKDSKALLICRTREKVFAINEAIKDKININIALFYEDLELLQRDRNAAYFAEEEGAQIMLCSEIGSEGRNFQFAHHLIFFDIPTNPELLEQRIGRLDRIGQTETIQIHVPFIQGCGAEYLLRWYNEGLNAFKSILTGGSVYSNEFGESLKEIVKSKDLKGLEKLIKKTKKFKKELQVKLETGRDRLLELNSYDSKKAKLLVKEIRALDGNKKLESILLDLFELFGVKAEELDASLYKLTPTERYMEAFPGIPNEGILITFKRERAITRDEIQFITADHPMVVGAFQMLLGEEKGNSSFCIYPQSGKPGFLIESVFIAECPAPKSLHIDRFLPPTPIRVLVNHEFEEVTQDFNHSQLNLHLENGPLQLLQQHKSLLQTIIPNQIKKARNIARKNKAILIEDSIDQASDELNEEIDRLIHLQKVNDHISSKEIDQLENKLKDTQDHLKDTHLRLDSIRLILLQ